MITRTPIGIRIATLTFVALAAAALSGCGGGPAGPTTEVVPFSAEELRLREAAKDARYRLRPGDELAIDLEFTSRLDHQKIQVLPDGHLSISGLGSPRAEGLTLVQLDSLLTERYAETYRDPEVVVRLEKMGASKVYVLGQVRNPGMYTLPETGAGALQAVVLAGGFDEFAKPSETILIRVVESGYQYVRVNLDDLARYREIAPEATILRPFDVVYVPRSRVGDFAFFAQNVLGGALKITDLFWDIYGIANIDKVDRLVR